MLLSQRIPVTDRHFSHAKVAARCDRRAEVLEGRCSRQILPIDINCAALAHVARHVFGFLGVGRTARVDYYRPGSDAVDHPAVRESLLYNIIAQSDRLSIYCQQRPLCAITMSKSLARSSSRFFRQFFGDKFCSRPSKMQGISHRRF